MDLSTWIAVGIAGVAFLVALIAIDRLLRQNRAIDDAISRVGAPVVRGRQRRQALAAALDELERSLASAQRDRARLAGAVQVAPLGILITDDAGVVVTINQASDRFLGPRLGEAVTEVRVRQAIDEAILSRRGVEREVELYTPVRRVVEVTAIPLDFGIESVGAVAFMHDVTEDRRVVAMRRDFIANVSHELKTPLAALAVLSETLAGSVRDPSTAAALGERVSAEAHRLADLVDDILDLSEAEATEVKHRPVALARIVSDVEARFAGPAEELGVDLTIDPVPEEAVVAGKPRQLRTMVGNLVDNAIKHAGEAPEGGAPVRVTTSVVGDRVRIAVQDRGIGISDAHLDRIFERFYRIDRARSRDRGGTGLGLSIVRHIARTHGGDVSVESIEGRGSTFVVDLPLGVSG